MLHEELKSYWQLYMIQGTRYANDRSNLARQWWSLASSVRPLEPDGDLLTVTWKHVFTAMFRAGRFNRDGGRGGAQLETPRRQAGQILFEGRLYTKAYIFSLAVPRRTLESADGFPEPIQVAD